jgi:hypothetical protein
MVLKNASFLVIDGITLTFGMTSFCMRLKYNIKDIINSRNNSQFTILIVVQAMSLNIPAQRVSGSILQQMSWLLLLMV